jgi:hypothetical protein
LVKNTKNIDEFDSRRLWYKKNQNWIFIKNLMKMYHLQKLD